jgi:3-hydroxyacyl-[acyl-carrier-protein] dehydratase
MEEKKYAMDTEEVKKYLPHRYPFLFVDRVLEIRETGLTAFKNISGNEAFFQGHFPDYPVMPGVLQIEALAQAGALFVIYKYKLQNKPVYFMALDKVRFRSQVVPGDVLTIEVELQRFGGKVARVYGKGLVGDTVALEANMIAMIDQDPETSD